MWGGSALAWLECSRCELLLETDALRGTCRCGGVLLARYRLEDAARTLTRAALPGRPASQWRYAEVLPGSGDPVTLGEGMSPLLPLRFLARSLGLETLLMKDESSEPTGSFKARGMSTAVTMARRLGARTIVLPSAGNAGSAAAAYAAAAGLAAEVFLPADTPEPFRLEASAYGARVHLIDGDLSDCGRALRESGATEGAFDLSTLREPYRLEGKKTLAYEIAEQLDWDLPDVVIVPTGGGTALVGIWKALEELDTLGLVASGRRPRLVAVQAERCAPIVRAFETGAESAEAWSLPATYACGLKVPKPYADTLILQAIRGSAGKAIAVSDRAMAQAQLDLARGEGIFAAPEGAATLAALRALVSDGTVGPSDRVVLVNTGSGLKYPDVPGLRVP